MTYEEMQRTMQFILEQQAQFTADIQKLHESQAETNQLLNRLAAVTVKGFEDTNAKINALSDAQIRTEENIQKNDEAVNAKINALINAQTQTDEAVRNLAELVDRQLRERRNGG